MGEKKGLGLASKLNILMIGLLLMASAGISCSVIKIHKAGSYAELLRNGMRIAAMVSLSSEYAIYTEDRKALENIAENFQGEDIAYLALLNKDKRPLIEKSFQESGKVPDGNRTRVSLGQSMHMDLVDNSGKPYVEFFSPVMASAGASTVLFQELGTSTEQMQVIGYVQLGLTLDGLQEQSRSFLLSIILITATVIVVGVLITLMLTRRITLPIRRLAAATQDISEGRIDQVIQVNSHDEICELARSFNLMLRRLREYREEVEQQHRTLEERVIQRTLALEKKTEEAQELAHRATEASRAKSQFLANMSHEIRTPMNGVIGLTELMLNTTLTEKQSGLARMVLHSGEALLRIINDILDFSKIEAGRLELDLIDFNLWETIEEVVALFAEHAHRKEIELICDIRTSVPVNVNGDPVRLRQVLTNLLGNAVKFTERGEVMVRTTAFRKEDEIHTLEFEIIDTGIGIPPNARTRIFDAFSQADGSMSRKYGGTGLGLAICRQLVEMMGGSIALESTPGCGSTFRFSVQLVERPETSVKTSAGKESLRGARLLIADDNEANRLVLAERTESWGMNCKTAVDGSSALEVLREAGSRNEPFDLAILDKMMPGMDGLELARSIKADPSISSVRIIMLTSPGEFIETDEVRQSGILAYLSKPVRQSSLYDILLGALQTGENWEVSLPGHRSQSCPANPSFRGSILVAEDNAINQMVIKSMLLGMGLRVEVVATGQQALAQFAAKSFDLIFMDCQMPEMDGYEAARKMREKEEASLNRNDSHVPIVALTAHAMEGDQDLCIQAGMDDYLSKPFTYKQLCSVLERWITPVRNVQPPHGNEEAMPEDNSNLEVDILQNTQPGNHNAKGLYSGPPERFFANYGGEPAGDLENSKQLIIDRRVWEELRDQETGGSDDLLYTLIESYLAESSELMEKLQGAIRLGESTMAWKTAHSWSSSSAMLGAHSLAELLKRIQVSCKQGSNSGSEEATKVLLEEIVKEYGLLRDELLRELKSRPVIAEHVATGTIPLG